jgi:hypothetical protein
VTPGQLPTYSVLPVMALKRVVLPEFGLPAKAIFIRILLIEWNGAMRMWGHDLIMIIIRPDEKKQSCCFYSYD